MSMNRLSTAERVRIVACLVEGMSIRATCRITGYAKGTVLKLLTDLGDACADHHDRAARNLTCHRLQLDELWSFCYAKDRTVARNPALKLREDGAGDVWTWTALDADTKFMVNWYVGEKDPPSAYAFLKDLAWRVVNRPQVTTDGFKVYRHAVQYVFDHNVDYAVLVKVFGEIKPDGRIGTTLAAVVGTEKKIIAGEPDERHISTSFVERSNLTMRMHTRRYTRCTNAFSKKLANHRAAVELHFTYYNWCRVHQTLKQTPAMAAGLADHPWSLDELVGLLEAREDAAIAAGALKRGSYKPRNSN